MISLYFFAPIVESEIGAFGLILLYLTGAVVSLIPNYFKNKRFCKYEAIGASGAVSAVVFASIMLAPTAKLMIIFLPIPMAAWFFGVLFLGISFYMYKRDTDNVGHDVHIFGGIWGLIFIILFYVYQAVNCLM
jgi:membrane associated rhomboid family serine protease